jgi:hypothetical protein
MSHLDDQLPTITHPTPEEAAIIFCKYHPRDKPYNQDFQSPETKPRARTYLTRNEAAEYLRIGRNLLDHHPKGIPFYKICGRVLYIKEELDEIIRRSRQGGES